MSLLIIIQETIIKKITVTNKLKRGISKNNLKILFALFYRNQNKVTVNLPSGNEIDGLLNFIFKLKNVIFYVTLKQKNK